MSDVPRDEPPVDPRPWEQPGAVRRDVEPHRADLLAALGNAALVCGGLSICGGVTVLLSLPLGLSVWVLAWRDLARMRSGWMDPTGRCLTARKSEIGDALR